MGGSIDIVESLAVRLAAMEHYKRVKIGASASRIVKRKRGAQQDDNSAPPFKKMKTKRRFLPYEEAKKVVNALGLKSVSDWERWSCTERPPDIPGCPWSFYKDTGWNGFADWLEEEKSPVLLPDEEANKQIYVIEV